MRRKSSCESMSGRIGMVRSNRAPAGRQRMTVSHGATKEPARRPPLRHLPRASCTAIPPPGSNETTRAARPPRSNARLWSASSAAHAIHVAKRIRRRRTPGIAARRASVASDAAATPHAADREGPREISHVASLYLCSRAAAPTFIPMPLDFVADLSHNALIGVTGDDAAAFLHGQFTNDVESLAPGEAQWNGWCSAKGRLLATFLLLRRADGFLLMLPAEIAAPVAKRLSMFVLRSKVKIQDVSGAHARAGIAGPGVAAWVEKHFGSAPKPLRALEGGGATCVALDGQRFVVFAPAAAPALRDLFPGEWQRAGADA